MLMFVNILQDCAFLFHKELRASDVNSLGRIVLPKVSKVCGRYSASFSCFPSIDQIFVAFSKSITKHQQKPD